MDRPELFSMTLSKVNPRSVIERRQTPRIHSFYPVKIFKEGETAVQKLANLRDISQGGLQFRLGEPLAPGSVWQCIVLMAQNDSRIQAEIEIVWVRRISEQDSYHVGAVFRNLSEADRTQIHQWVEACSRTSGSTP